MKNKWLILTLVFSLLAGAALLTGRHFHTHDDLQVFRLNEYLKCFQDGQIPCRWSAEMGKGYGYPYFIFYPPMVYALPAIIHVLTGQSLIFSLNLAAYLTFPLAAYAMYRLIYTLTGKEWAAGFASVLYTFAPYHALNLFVRGVYAENLAWALFPLLLAWVYDLVKKNQGYFRLTVGVSLLLLTHNISALLMLPTLVVWGLLIGGRDLRKLIRLFTSFLFAAGLSAWFLIPALLEKSLVQTESMVFDYYNYLNHFVSLKQIFLSNYWGFGGSGYETEFDEMSFAIGYPLTTFAAIGLTILLRARKISRQTKTLSLFSLLVGLLALFMTHAKSTFIWAGLPILAYLQFPWRFLGIATTMLIAGSAVGLSVLKGRLGKIIGLVLVVAAIVLYAGHFRPEKYDSYVDSDFTAGQFTSDQQSAHVFDYLPKTALSVPDEFRDSPIFRAAVPVTVSRVSRTSRSLSLDLNSPQNQEIVLAQYAYPGWAVSVDGLPVNHSPDPTYGFITLPVAAGSHEVKTIWRETPVRQASNSLTVISLLFFLLYNIYYAKKP